MCINMTVNIFRNSTFIKCCPIHFRIGLKMYMLLLTSGSNSLFLRSQWYIIPGVRNDVN